MAKSISYSWPYRKKKNKQKLWHKRHQTSRKICQLLFLSYQPYQNNRKKTHIRAETTFHKRNTHTNIHTHRPHSNRIQNSEQLQLQIQFCNDHNRVDWRSVYQQSKKKKTNKQNKKRGKFKTSFDKIYLKKSKKVLQTVANDSRKNKKILLLPYIFYIKR